MKQQQNYSLLANERLLTELIPYYKDGRVQHPFISMYVQPDNFSHINAMYLSMVEFTNDALKKNDYLSYIMHHPNANRSQAFWTVEEMLSEDCSQDGIPIPIKLMKLVKPVWNSSEYLFLHLNDWIDFFKGYSDYLTKIMDKKEIETLNSMPEEITIYRGCVTGKYDNGDTWNNENGLSWTIDKDIADFFTTYRGSNGYIIEGKVKKKNVIAYINERNEKVIIVLPENVCMNPIMHVDT